MNLVVQSMRIGNCYAGVILRNTDAQVGDPQAFLEVRWLRYGISGVWGNKTCVNNGTETIATFNVTNRAFFDTGSEAECGESFARFVTDPNGAMVERVL